MEEVIAYTDGSSVKQKKDKKRYHGGAGVVLMYKGKMKEISHPIPEGTNNIAELTACILALKSLKRPCKVKLYTDSQYCLKAMTQWVKGWLSRDWKTAGGDPVKNQDLLKELYSLCQVHNVEWVWVKGHNGDCYNELADKLACEASDSLKVKEEMIN